MFPRYCQVTSRRSELFPSEGGAGSLATLRTLSLCLAPAICFVNMTTTHPGVGILTHFTEENAEPWDIRADSPARFSAKGSEDVKSEAMPSMVPDCFNVSSQGPMRKVPSPRLETAEA